MKIRRIHIMGFGKLNDYTLEFEDGFQVIGAENEFGKSTIMNFILMMFYGKTDGGQDIQRNIRLHYRPWDGSPMGGMMEFEYDGREYRLEKKFGKSPSTDDVFLLDMSSGSQVPLVKGEEVGMYFMGMDIDAFRRSVFIEKSIMESGSTDKDYLAEKLGNLHNYGDENDQGQEAAARLREAMEDLISKSGRSGRFIKKREEYKKAEAEYQSLVKYNEKVKANRKEWELLDQAMEAEHINEELVNVNQMLQEMEEEYEDRKKYGFLLIPSIILLIFGALIWKINMMAGVMGIIAGIMGTVISSKKEYVEKDSPLKRKLQNQKSELILQKNRIKVSEKYQNMPIKELKSLQRQYQSGMERITEMQELEEKIEQLEQQLRDMQEYYDALKLAYEGLEEIQLQRRKSFRPMLHQRASWIFRRMTGQNYDSVLIQKDYKAFVTEMGGMKSIDWRYLSSGTKDQLYLSMRLAAAELMSEKEKLPILLDDVLERYDDERVEETIAYLKACGKDTQVILFTCHGSIMRLGGM